MSAALEATVTVRRGDFVLEASLSVAAGEVLALLGPNGSGKSTLLGALAGQLPLESGEVRVGSRVLSRRTSSANGRGADGRGADVAVAPEGRRMGLLGQEPLLFPHLTAEENIAFGRRSRGVRNVDAVREARDWLRAVGLTEFGRRKPAQLSGGQQQRVAIARALAVRPDVVLLDEPMAALDVQTAVLIRQLLHDQLARSGTTAVLVTHDVLDAIVLADRVAILHDGRIIDEGATSVVLAKPRNRFIAALVGVNLLPGVMDVGGQLRRPDGSAFAGLPADEPIPHSGTAAAAVFRPSSVRVHLTEPAPAHAVNCWQESIASLEPSSGGILIRTADTDSAGIVAELSPAEVTDLKLRPGQRIWLTVASEDVSIHSLP